jgi:hypothetical protein
VLTAVEIPSAQVPSFTGTWKLNMAKSQLTGQTITIERAASGLYHFANGDFGYDFDLSGKEFPMPDGGTTSWRVTNATTWDVSNRNGNAVTTFHLQLNGDTHTAVMRTTTPDGKTIEQASKMSRVSGGPGFLGKWRSTEVKGAAPTMKINVDGNSIAMTFPETQTVCTAKFDGKDYPVAIGGASAKQTWSFDKTGTLSFKMTTKLNGKPVGVDIMTLDADGKTLTDDSNWITVNEPAKALYERQP